MIKLSRIQIVLIALVLTLTTGGIRCQDEFSWLPQRWGSHARMLNKIIQYRQQLFQTWVKKFLDVNEMQWTDLSNLSLQVTVTERPYTLIDFDKISDESRYNFTSTDNGNDTKRFKEIDGSNLPESRRIGSKLSKESNISDRRNSVTLDQRKHKQDDDLSGQRGIEYRYLRQSDSILVEDIRHFFERTENSMSLQTISPTIRTTPPPTITPSKKPKRKPTKQTISPAVKDTSAPTTVQPFASDAPSNLLPISLTLEPTSIPPENPTPKPVNTLEPISPVAPVASNTPTNSVPTALTSKPTSRPIEIHTPRPTKTLESEPTSKPSSSGLSFSPIASDIPALSSKPTHMPGPTSTSTSIPTSNPSRSSQSFAPIVSDIPSNLVPTVLTSTPTSHPIKIHLPRPTKMLTSEPTSKPSQSSVSLDPVASDIPSNLLPTALTSKPTSHPIEIHTPQPTKTVTNEPTANPTSRASSRSPLVNTFIPTQTFPPTITFAPTVSRFPIFSPSALTESPTSDTPRPVPLPVSPISLAPEQTTSDLPSDIPSMSPQSIPIQAPTPPILQPITGSPILISATSAPTILPTVLVPVQVPTSTLVCNLTRLQREEQILGILNDITTESTMLSPGTAQNSAFKWVLDVDGARSCPQNATDVLQRYILAVVYYSSGGDRWNRCNDNASPVIRGCSPPSERYLSDANVCQWYNINCDGLLGNITDINLADNNLNGTIPSEISALSRLESIDLDRNLNLIGSIPTELGQLSLLRVLDLNSSQLSGPALAPQLCNATQLQRIDLRSNILEGTIPSCLGDLNSLQIIALDSNIIEGTLPSQLGRIDSLRSLTVNMNGLTGTIPGEITNENLEIVSLQENSFSGTIPTTFGSLTNVETLNFFANFLTGTVPTQLGNLSKLRNLFLHFNELTGSMPAEICALGLQQLTADCGPRGKIQCDQPECCTACF